MTLVEKILAAQRGGHAGHRRRPRARRRRFRPRATGASSIEYYTPHDRAHAPPELRQAGCAARSLDDHRLRGPPHLRASQPETHVKQGLLPFVRDLSAAHQRLRAHGCTALHATTASLPSRRQKASAGICHAMMAEQYALPGPARGRHRLAHAAQRRAGLLRLRRRHDRHGERVGHRRSCALPCRSRCASSSTAASRRASRPRTSCCTCSPCPTSRPAAASARCSSSPGPPSRSSPSTSAPRSPT